MTKSLPFFNWSLRKALDTEPDSFVKARINIIFTILLFSLLKIVVVIVVGATHGQSLQVVRALVALVFYLASLKVLLYSPSRLKLLAHIMVIFGVLVVWTNLFVYAHQINLATVQFVFMIAMSSFYVLGSSLGLTYSAISMLPIILMLVFRNNAAVYFTNGPQELASPGYEIVVVLNFLSITVSHYLFYEAFRLNLTEKEELNQQLILSAAEANKLAETKSNFLSTISHELRTPLNSVIGISELLIDDDPEERQKENLKILQYSALDLLSLINNVLDFNKIDSDKLVLEMVAFCPAEFMRNISRGLMIKANDKQLSFLLDIDKQLEGVYVVSDPTRLSQLIYNLVSNAIKFTEKGSITVKLACVRKNEDTVDILFSVTDTGIGIHPDRHETIFELFTQAESHITRKYGGTGLGLAIVKQVLKLFNSSIQLESSPGNGTRFFFTIPFTITSEVPEDGIPTASDRPNLGWLKILVAEDNNFNRLIIEKQLEKLNIKSVLVENGQQAIDAFLTDDFDAILLDLHMPVLDGYGAAKQIRALPDPGKAGIYLIAFTASVNEQEKIMETGFDDYVYKPVNTDDLSEKLGKMVQQNRRRHR